MSTSKTQRLPAALLTELENDYFWWDPVGVLPRSPARILGQAMNLASFEDVRRLEKTLGHHLLLEAEPGWIDERSWELWRGRLAHVTGRSIPDAPPRRSLDASKN